MTPEEHKEIILPFPVLDLSVSPCVAFVVDTWKRESIFENFPPMQYRAVRRLNGVTSSLLLDPVLTKPYDIKPTDMVPLWRVWDRLAQAEMGWFCYNYEDMQFYVTRYLRNIFGNATDIEPYREQFTLMFDQNPHWERYEHTRPCKAKEWAENEAASCNRGIAAIVEGLVEADPD